MKIEQYPINDSFVYIPIAESYGDCMKLIKSDRYRLSGKIESSLSIVLRNLKPFSRPILFWLRLSQYKKGILYPFCRFMYECAARKSQIQIPPATKIGYGFYIGHAICMVINHGTIIGNNLNVSQFLNIGTNRRTPAIIGDNVYIGPHVSIVEDVKIATGSTIGAGAVVTRDVPEDATAVGIPAKVIGYENPRQYINNAYPTDFK